MPEVEQRRSSCRDWRDLGAGFTPDFTDTYEKADEGR